MKQQAEARNIPEQRDFAVGRGLVVLHHAADGDGLAVGRDDDGIGGFDIDVGRAEIAVGPSGDDGRLIGHAGDLRRQDHFHHVVRRDERSDLQDDAHDLVGNGGMFIAKCVVVDTIDDWHILANLDGRLLIVASHDGRARQDFDLADFLNCANRGFEIIPGDCVQSCAGQRIDTGGRGNPLLCQAEQIRGADRA